MEHGDSFFAQVANSSSGSQMNSSANEGNTIPINSNNDGVVPHLAVRDKNNIPITSVTKIMRRALPSYAKISESSKETVQQCLTRYITVITTKAKERCQKDYRKIMTTEDLMWAMQELHFHDYIAPLNAYIQRYRHNEGEPLSTHHVKPIPDTNGPGPDPVENNGPGSSLFVPTVEMLQQNFVKPTPDNNWLGAGPVMPTAGMFQPNFVSTPDNNGPGIGPVVPTAGMLQPNFMSIPDDNGLVVPTSGMFQPYFVNSIPDNNGSGAGPVVPTAGMLQPNFMSILADNGSVVPTTGMLQPYFVSSTPDNNGPGTGPVVPTAGLFHPNFVNSISDNNGLGPVMPTVGMLQPTLSPPPPPMASFGSDFFMDPNTNLGMFGPIDLDDFFGNELGVGGSNSAMNNFDPSAQFNYDHM